MMTSIREWSKSGGLGAVLLISAMSVPVSLAGPLEDYLAKPVSSVKWDWGTDAPQISVRKYQRMFRMAETDAEKGIAIGNLSVIAQQMAMSKATLDAGRQLNDQWVIPNLECTRAIDNSFNVGWRHTVLRARNIYRLSGDHESEKKCLELVFKAEEREGDKDLAVYLLAYQQAGQGNYQTAIKTINYLKEDSKWARNRKQLIRIWTKEMNRKQKAATR